MGGANCDVLTEMVYRKPEWMLMYQEIVYMHQVNGNDRYPFSARIVTEDTESHFRLMVDWCLENLEFNAWRWQMLEGNLDDQIEFSFTSRDDLVLFKLVWQ